MSSDGFCELLNFSSSILRECYPDQLNLADCYLHIGPSRLLLVALRNVLFDFLGIVRKVLEETLHIREFLPGQFRMEDSRSSTLARVSVTFEIISLFVIALHLFGIIGIIGIVVIVIILEVVVLVLLVNPQIVLVSFLGVRHLCLLFYSS